MASFFFFFYYYYYLFLYQKNYTYYIASQTNTQFAIFLQNFAISPKDKNFLGGCLITRFGVMVVLFKVALYNKNTILPSAQSPTRLLLPSSTNKFLLSLPHPHAFWIPLTPCPSDRRRRRHAHP
jgi:hypothetical protein